MPIVLWDFDGPITNTIQMTFQLRRMEYPELTLEKYIRIHEGNFFEEIARKGFARKKFDYLAAYASTILDSPLIHGIKKSIEKLAQAFEMSIISGNDSKAIKNYLAHHNLYAYFKNILGSEVGGNKVKKLRMALKSHNTTADNAIYVTDTPGDVKEARKAGILCIAVMWGFCPHEMLALSKPRQIIGKANLMVQTVEKIFKSRN